MLPSPHVRCARGSWNEDGGGGFDTGVQAEADQGDKAGQVHYPGLTGCEPVQDGQPSRITQGAEQRHHWSQPRSKFNRSKAMIACFGDT